MSSTQAAAQSNWQPAGIIVVHDERYYFFNNVIVVALLSPGTMALIPVIYVRPALSINSINTEKLNIAIVDKIGNSIDHSEISKVVAHRILTWENQNWSTAPAVNLNVHVTVYSVTVPGCLSVIH